MNENIKTYTDKKGQELFRFQIYLGKNKTTGSSKYVRRRGFSSYDDALKEYNKLIENIKNGEYENKKREKRNKFKDMFKRWSNVYKTTIKESTYASTLRIFNKHILPILGNIYLDKLTIDKCERAVMKWQIEAPRTFKRYIRYTNNVLDYAVNLELISSNPMRKVIRPKVVKTKKQFIDFYNKEELEKFLHCCKKSESFKVYMFFHLLAYTGMRKGEALALEWSDFDLEGVNDPNGQPTVKIKRTLTSGLNNRLIVNTPKTVNSIRTIDLDPITVKLLKQWKNEQLKELFKIGINALNKKEQLVFPDALNKHLYPSKPTQWNNRICKRYGLRHIKVHGFRHTHASLLFETGLSMEEVKERLGHSNITTTMNIYTHVTKSRKKRAAIMFAKYMEG